MMVKKPSDLLSLDGLILPGGESTTISRFLKSTKIYEPLKNQIINDDLAVMGTCAGLVLLADALDEHIIPGDLHILHAMNMQVRRNAFGRQRESFEHAVTIKGLSAPFPAVFIRAPIITKVFDGCNPIGYFEKHIIAAQQNRCLALSFHPELTADHRIHQQFLEML